MNINKQVLQTGLCNHCSEHQVYSNLCRLPLCNNSVYVQVNLKSHQYTTVPHYNNVTDKNECRHNV